MKFRRRPTPLLLLLLPSLASAISAATQDNIDSTLTKNKPARGSAIDPNASPIIDLNSKPKYGIGTKDAPVDGKDGKPHAGPWVGDKEAKKAKSKDKDSKKTSTATDPSKLIAADGTKIPTSNDGVMDDPHRQPPKVGTTGTEGGVSEKDKVRKAQEGQTGARQGKRPDSPKAAPPLPHSEEKIKGKGKPKVKEIPVDDEDDGEGLGGLEKPNDLPSKPNNAPHPLPVSANKDHLDINPIKKSGKKLDDDDEEEEEEGLIQPFHSFVLSLTMILFSEIGDKTFLIAALMAMKHDRMLVFSAAFSALITMTVLSAVLGHAVPSLLPKRFTNLLAAGLFLIFGGRLLKEGLAMSPEEGVGAEMQEVEQELAEKEHEIRQKGGRRSTSPHALEMGLGGRSRTRKSRSGSRLPSPPRSPSTSSDRSPSPQRSKFKGTLGGLNNLLGFLLSPAWVQTFVMTFLGEWGDRSQIATIAMAAGQDYWWVTGGAVSGHAICTGVAVIGGRAIAGKVSMRVVTLGGAGAFLVFGVIYLVEALLYG